MPKHFSKFFINNLRKCRVNRPRARFINFSLLGVALLMVAALTAAQTNQERRTGSITGQVVVEEGALIGGARIFVLPMGGGSTNTGSRSLVTDAEGRFTVSEVDVRPYRISASLPGYVTAVDTDLSQPVRTGETVTINLVKGGVITGRVTKSNGDPVIGISVTATRVRDEAGKAAPLNRGMGSRPAMTDDRGVYRIYGLLAGSYVVMASGNMYVTPMASPYTGDAPVFYPSSTRDGATEVQVQLGGEASGVDIRYRGEHGFTVSGKVAGAVQSSDGRSGVSVRLMSPGGRQALASAFVDTARERMGFEIIGVAPGDYELVASRTERDGSSGAFSSPRRVSVTNADVGGLELTLASLASMTGKVVLEPLPELKPEEKALCVKGRTAALTEIMLSARNLATPLPGNDAFLNMMQENSFSLAADGAFSLGMLESGSYRLSANLPGESWYVKSITVGANRSGLLSIKASEKLSGVAITLAEGAAQITGKLETKPTTAMRVHLVPADVALADDVTRYAEAPVRVDGSFALTHLAPGKYWMITQVANPEGSLDGFVRPLSWDNQARATLRKAAEAAQQTVELSPCMRLSGFKLK